MTDDPRRPEPVDPLADTQAMEVPSVPPRGRAPASQPPDDEPPSLPGGGASRNAPRLVVVFALLVLAGGGYGAYALYADQDATAEPALAALPESVGEIEVRPLVGIGTGHGWTWVNPRPRAMTTWFGVDRSPSGERVVMVGRRGQAARFEDGSLYQWQTGVTPTLHGVAYLDDEVAVAVGDEGALTRLAPDGPHPLETGVSVALRAVVARRAVGATVVGATVVGATVVGDGATVLSIDGDEVRRLDVSLDPAVDLLAAFERGERVYVAGSRGTVARLDEGVLTVEQAPGEAILRAIGGCDAGPIYAAGDDGTLLRRRSDGTWRSVRVATGGEAFHALSCDHGRVAAVANDGRIWLVSGDHTMSLPSGFDRPWYGVRGGAEGPTWVVGVGGRLATIEVDHVRTRTAGPTHPITAVGGMGGALVAVGPYGRLLRERQTGLSEVESPTDAGLSGLIQLEEGRLIAVGDFGAMLDIRFDRSTLLPTPSRGSMRDGVSEGGQLLVVGAGGQVWRGTPEALSASVVPEVADLQAIAGTPSDAYAVGDDGAVLHFVEGGFTRLPCAGATLRAVARRGDEVYAVGDAGRIVRIAPAGCVEEEPAEVALRAIGVGPEGRWIAGGEDGVVIERGDSGWTPVPVDVAHATVLAIWRNDRYVYLAGTGGILVRHILLDGT